MTGRAPVRIAGAFCSCLTAAWAPVAAQEGAAGEHHVLVAHAAAPAGGGASGRFLFVGTFGAGVVATAARTSRYRMEPGIVGALGVQVTGRPWITGSPSPETGMRQNKALVLRGVDLDLGVKLDIHVAGLPARVLERRRGAVIVRLAPLLPPGPHAVRATHRFGVIELPGAVLVRPLLELTNPPAKRGRFGLRYRGTRGDRVAVMFSLRLAPAPVRFPGIDHVLELDPAGLRISEVSVVERADGTATAWFPNWPGGATVHVQAVVAGRGEIYGPRTFTNRVELRL